MGNNLDLRVGGKYRLQRRLGGGSFGAVYQGTDLSTDEDVAIKLEHVSIDPSLLETEVDIYRALSGGAGIPRVFWYDTECEYNAMVFDLLGPSLGDLFNYCGCKFSLKTVLLLADQLICRVEYIHSKNFLHRDIKPENFLMGVGRCGNIVYMTDLGLATEYSDTQPGDGASRAWKPKLELLGTARFASINGHMGKKQSRRDDLESLGYMMIYFLRGALPWQGFKAVHQKKAELILERKKEIDAHTLSDGLPREFLIYFEHINALGVNDKPDYSYLRKQFTSLFKRKGFVYDNVFDWTVLKYLESTQHKNSEDSHSAIDVTRLQGKQLS